MTLGKRFSIKNEKIKNNLSHKYMRKYLYLFVTNLLVLLVLSIVLVIIGVDTKTWVGFAIFCVIFGMGGAFINLYFSVWIAKKWYGVHIIDEESKIIHEKQSFLYNKCIELSRKAGIESIQIGIYNSAELNAFATGVSKNKSLLAFSSGLSSHMNNDEIEGVIAHEIGHVVSGDMVTMTLLQGLANAFVIFAARLVANIIDNYLDNEDEDEGFGLSIWGYWILVWILEIAFMTLAYVLISYVSRKREYAADRYSAELAGKHKMISALQSLESQPDLKTESKRDSIVFSKIHNKKKVYLFETHPHIEDRIASLNKL